MSEINIVKPFLPLIEEVYEDFQKCLLSGLVTNNSENVRVLEKKLHHYLGSKLTPLLFCNGEMALYNLILATKLKLGYNFEDSFSVLVPSFTFCGTINALVANNLKPVFCDVNETLTIDLEKIQVTEDIKMMLVVGSYGNLPDINQLIDFCIKNKIHVVFDNAPAFLSKYKSNYVCNLGFDEIYSFHASKIFNTMEGGCVVTNDDYIHETLKKLRDFGQYEKIRGNVDCLGLNSKMNEVCAIVGLKNIEKIEFILSERQKNIKKYIDFFSELELNGKLTTMKVKDEVTCNYLYFPIILNEDASKFVDFLKLQKINVRRYYTATHNLDFYINKFKNFDLTFTEKIKDRVVSIPIHTIMDEDEINYLFTSIKKYFSI